MIVHTSDMSISMSLSILSANEVVGMAHAEYGEANAFIELVGGLDRPLARGSSPFKRANLASISSSGRISFSSNDTSPIAWRKYFLYKLFALLVKEN